MFFLIWRTATKGLQPRDLPWRLSFVFPLWLKHCQTKKLSCGVFHPNRVPALQSVGWCTCATTRQEMALVVNRKRLALRQLDERGTQLRPEGGGVLTSRLDVQLAVERCPVWRHQILFHMRTCCFWWNDPKCLMLPVPFRCSFTHEPLNR